MSSCYLCGRKIPDGTGVRREVATGESRTIGFFGKRIGGSASERYGFRLICQQCDTKMVVSNLSISIAKFILGGLVLIVLLIYNTCNSGTDNKNSEEYNPPKSRVDALMAVDTTTTDTIMKAVKKHKHHKAGIKHKNENNSATQN